MEPFSPPNDPRLVTRTFGGVEYHFWFCEDGMEIAENIHDFNLEKYAAEDHSGEREVNLVMRQLWIAHLPFDPHLSFRDFRFRFPFGDRTALMATIGEIVKKQMGIDPEAGEQPKKKAAAKK
jgi:hypothetical protein